MPVIKTCNHCGVSYKRQPCEAEKSFYCSKKCQSDFQIIDHKNERFKNLVAETFVERRGNGTFWMFRCDCGKLLELNIQSVKRGSIYCCVKYSKNLDITQLRTCVSCETETTLENFPVEDKKTLRRSKKCQQCHSNYRKAYRTSNKERLNALATAYRRSNPKARQWNKEGTRRWKERNPLAVRAMRENRRALEKTAEGRITRKNIEDLYLKQNGKCACCGVDLNNKFHIDHIIPLSRGGSNFPENIQLLTPPCNQAKSFKTMEEFLNERQMPSSQGLSVKSSLLAMSSKKRG